MMHRQKFQPYRHAHVIDEGQQSLEKFKDLKEKTQKTLHKIAAKEPKCKPSYVLHGGKFHEAVLDPSPVTEMNELISQLDEKQYKEVIQNRKSRTNSDYIARLDLEMASLQQNLNTVRIMVAKLEQEFDRHKILAKVTKETKGFNNIIAPDPELKLSLAKAVGEAMVKLNEDNGNGRSCSLIHPSKHSEYMFHIFSEGAPECVGSVLSLASSIKMLIIKNIATDLLQRVPPHIMADMHQTYTNEWHQVYKQDASCDMELALIDSFEKVFINLISRLATYVSNILCSEKKIEDNFRLFVAWFFSLGVVPLLMVPSNSANARNTSTTKYCLCSHIVSSITSAQYSCCNSSELDFFKSIIPEVVSKYCSCRGARNGLQIHVVEISDCVLVKQNGKGGQYQASSLSNPDLVCNVFVPQTLMADLQSTTICGKMSGVHSGRAHAEKLRKKVIEMAAQPRVLLGQKALVKKLPEPYEHPELEKLRCQEKTAREKLEIQSETIKKMSREVKDCKQRVCDNNNLMKILRDVFESENMIGQGALKSLVPVLVAGISGDTSEFLVQMKELRQQVDSNANWGFTGKIGTNPFASNAKEDITTAPRHYAGGRSNPIHGSSHLDATSGDKYDISDREFLQSEAMRQNIASDIKKFMMHQKTYDGHLELDRAKKQNAESSKKITFLIGLVERANHLMAAMKYNMVVIQNSTAEKDSCISHLTNQQQEMIELLESYKEYIEEIMPHLSEEERNDIGGEDMKGRKHGPSTLAQHIKVKQKELKTELKKFEQVKSKLEQIISDTRCTSVLLQKSSLFDNRTNKEDEQVNNVHVTRVSTIQDDYDEVLDTKMASAPDLQPYLDQENHLWTAIAVNLLKFGQVVTYSNNVVKFVPRRETNSMIIAPFFKAIFPHVIPPLDVDLLHTDGNLSQEKFMNPLEMLPTDIIAALFTDSNAGIALAAKRALYLDKKTSARDINRSISGASTHGINSGNIDNASLHFSK